MSTPIINVQTLARLADNGVQEMTQNFGALPIDIREAFERKMAEATRSTAEAAAEEIIKLMQAKDSSLASTAQAIQNLRKQISDLEGFMAGLQRAWDYGNATRNYVPLSAMLGMGTGGAKKELSTIPAGWTAPAPAAAVAAG